MDVTAATFSTDVVAVSHERPVVVDFWAPWCGPCRTLGPILEELEREGAGGWTLAKIDTDQEQALARQFDIRGIPAVKAFVDGEVVAEFTGAKPAHEVRAWLADLAGVPALKAVAAAGDVERARELLGTLSAEARSKLAGLVAQLELQAQAAGVDVDALQSRVEAGERRASRWARPSPPPATGRAPSSSGSRSSPRAAPTRSRRGRRCWRASRLSGRARSATRRSGA